MQDRIRPTVESPRGRYEARVLRNVRICAEHYRLTLGVVGFPASVPGQFVQVECRDVNAECGMRDAEAAEGYRVFEWGPGAGRPGVLDGDFAGARAYLRRPFSIAGRREAGSGQWPVASGQKGASASMPSGAPAPLGMAPGVTEIDVIHRVVGRGTRWLEGLGAGDGVSVLGPLGKGFWVPEEMELAVMVGGGVGIPPMFYMAEALYKAGVRTVGIVGAQRGDLLPVSLAAGVAVRGDGEATLCVGEFAVHGMGAVVTTDDGSVGMKGFVTGALRVVLQKQEARSKKQDAVVVYCCGPTAMMKAAAKVCSEFGVMCQVSLEQPMACGMGTCQSCVVKWRGEKQDARSKKQEGGTRNEGGTNAECGMRNAETGGQEWVYKLTCTDGPVFDAGELVW